MSVLVSAGKYFDALEDLNLFFFLHSWSEANGKQIGSPDI